MKKLFFISLCSLFITGYGAEQQPLAEPATFASTYFPDSWTSVHATIESIGSNQDPALIALFQTFMNIQLGGFKFESFHLILK